ncbi:FGGY-family carbohydrate kinase [Mesorhizobium sp. RP14(2022)]|uniref:FGGY-family carbohydrate kinase n=1 Tax=Mesorhizobium liriopis TaxID=2953882 RepID=A0ABT1C8Q2_9HYPH|nr:FGGY-family carbohydrate kinase [Mesorhizobium liriopis]MCO6051194.1 FGGY-family carbohydrate kinase [Mesorhizobium liriopis]
MTNPIRFVAVVDIGKTNAKLALVDLFSIRETAIRRMPNRVRRDGLYPHHDLEALWRFILEGLTELNRETPVDAVSVTTHGATVVVLDADGALALPVPDYEHDGPDELADAYDRVRPPFTETGSPRLPVGLNYGAQLFWQQMRFPDEWARVKTILPYAQYWSYRLSGVIAGEATSLGCHSDLWNPWEKKPSSLAESQGWVPLMAPVHQASDRLGPILRDVAQATGLRPDTPVFCGIHDSNASLLPHLLANRPPFSVVSTGTWVIAMAVGGQALSLDPMRDTLVNVSALGEPVPSARFMGGREYEVLMGSEAVSWGEADVAMVIERQAMLLPSVQAGSGPFPHRASAWVNGDDLSTAQRYVAVSFYLALMTVTCLDLIGAEGETILEGSFTQNPLFARMLASATGRPVRVAASGGTGTSIGAALLAAPDGARFSEEGRVIAPEPAFAPYAETWKQKVEG